MTRNGVWPGVFGPQSVGGLALNESTLPSLLRDVGYETFMAGKWCACRACPSQPVLPLLLM